MANNLSVTQGVGTVLATDEIAAVHYQKIKLVAGQEDSTDGIVGDIANGLDVDCTRLVGVTNSTDSTTVKVGDIGNNAIRVNVVAGVVGGTGQIDESAFTEGTTNFTPIGGVLNDTITSDPTEDQAAAARITAKRAIHVNLRNVGGTEIGTGSNPIQAGITSIVPGGSASSLGKQEDLAHTTGDTGVFVLGVRNDGAGIKTDTDGDYSPIATDGAGRVGIADLGGSVSIDDNASSLTIDAPTATPVPCAVTTTGDVLVKPGDSGNNAIRVNVVAGAAGGAAQADESTFTEGTTSFTPIGGVLNDTITSDPTEDQAAAARITAKRGLHVNLRNNAGVEFGTASNTVAVSITDTGNNQVKPGDSGNNAIRANVILVAPGNGPANLGKDEDTGHITGDTGVFVLGVRNDAAASRTSADADYSPISTDSAGRVGIADLGGTISIDDGAGSLTVDAPVGTPVAIRVSDGAAFINPAILSEQQSQTTSLQLLDDIVASDKGSWTEGTSRNAVVAGVVNDTISGDPAENQSAALRITPKRGLHVNLRDNVGVEFGTTTAPFSVSGTVASASTDSGNPIKVGGKAESTYITAVADGDRVDFVADLYGRQRVVTHEHPEKILGVYTAQTGVHTVLASADAATVGRWYFQNPVGSGVTARILYVVFRSSIATALATPTVPRINMELFTFTGTASGASVTPAKRKSGDPANVVIMRTASTGMTPSAGAVIESFFPAYTNATASGMMIPTDEIYNPPAEARTEIIGGEGIILRQADAGTTSDTRKYLTTVVWEEF